MKRLIAVLWIITVAFSFFWGRDYGKVSLRNELKNHPNVCITGQVLELDGKTYLCAETNSWKR